MTFDARDGSDWGRCACERTYEESTLSEKLTDCHDALLRYANPWIKSVDIPKSYDHLNEIELKLQEFTDWLTANDASHPNYAHIQQSTKTLQSKIESIRERLKVEEYRRKLSGISLTANAHIGTLEERKAFLLKADARREAGVFRQAIDTVCTKLGLPFGQL